MDTSKIRQFPEIILARFPFLNAVSLLMLLGERAKNEE